MSAAGTLSLSLTHGQSPPLSDEQVRMCTDNGFITLNAITTPEEVARIRSILTTLLAKKAGASEGALFDTLATTDDGDGQRSIQMTNPSNFARELRHTTYLRNAELIARQLLSKHCKFKGDFALLKPRQQGAGTPWHQDEAFRDPALTHKELSFWMPLQDVGIDEGCMVYLPGSQRRGVLNHRSPNDDPRAHALECSDELPVDQAVACPLPAGGCTIHTERTVHCTRDNISSSDRYAYILVFFVPPSPATIVRSFPWLEEKHTADRRTRRAWLLRGGIVVILMRKLREGDFWTLDGIGNAFKRGYEVLRGLH